MYKLILTLAVGLIIGVGGSIYYFTAPPPSSGNVITQGIVPQFATSSLATVGPQSVVTIVVRASNCTNRVISTQTQGIMLSFGGVTPTATTGHWQGASTTVNYDNGMYGCGAITGYAGASTTLTVTTFAQ